MSRGLRQFRAEDLAAVTALVRRTIDLSYAGIYPPLAIAHFHEHHTDEEITSNAEQGYTVVAERNGRIVATGTLVGDDVRRVYVEQAWQGRGLGRAIMEELEGRAAEQGAEEVQVYASLPAKPFYEQLGYVVVEEGARDCGEGQTLRWFHMSKRIKN
jgi:GNAT superfamily N-acetyltransferase